MIKKRTAYSIYCDVCGKEIGGVFRKKDFAEIYAAVNGSTTPDLQGHFCSVACRDKLIQDEEKKKGGSNADVP